MNSILKQLKQNSIAIASIFIALTALSYNTWRNENSEYNKNIRAAGFEMLLHVAALQRITYLAHFDNNSIEGNPQKGWVEIMLLRDLSKLMPDKVQHSMLDLFESWRINLDKLGDDDDYAVAKIDSSINKLREDIMAILETLD